MRRRAEILLLLALCAPAAHAQETPEEPKTGVSPAIGVHYGLPLRASISVGLLIDRSKNLNDGTIIMLEQGLQGTEISAGYFRMFSFFGTGFSLRGAVVRTGNDPWNASPKTTYVGGEAHAMFALGVGGRVGFLRRASRSENDPHDSLLSFGVSIGH